MATLEDLDRRLMGIEENSLPHIYKRLGSVEKLLYLALGVMVGTGALELRQLISSLGG